MSEKTDAEFISQMRAWIEGSNQQADTFGIWMKPSWWSRCVSLMKQGAQADTITTLRARIAELEADKAKLREAVDDLANFVDTFVDTDLDDLAADGGVTVGMVFQRDASTVHVPRARRIYEETA